MPAPLRLSDDQLDAVIIAARPLTRDRRDDFLQHIANILQKCSEPGPGDVYRAIVAAQRRYCDYPNLERTNHNTKYSRTATFASDA